MIKFVIQFLIMLGLLWANKKRKGTWFTPSGFLIFIYTLCSFMSIIDLPQGGWHQPFSDYYWWPMLFFDFYIFLFLFPFIRYKENRAQTIVLPNRQFLDIFSTVIIILSFYAIIFYLPTVRFIFASGDLGEMRNARYGPGGGEYVEAGILNTIASVSSANYVFAILLYFIYRILGKNKKRCTLLLISSTSNIFHILGFVGRDGVVFWLFTFAFCYFLFKPYMNDELTKSIKRILVITGSIVLIPFALITISRFGESDYGSSGSIISYLGQSFIQGPLYFGIQEKPPHTGGAFPLFYEWMGIAKPTSTGSYIIGDYVSWKFGTFVVGLYSSIGIWGLTLIALFCNMLYGIVHSKAHRMNMGAMTMYLLYFQIISAGVFYFVHYSRGGNLFIVTTVLIAICLYFSINNGKNVCLKRTSH